MPQPSLSEEAVFQLARRIEPADARNAYLDQICGTDLALRDRVLALLGSADGADQFLESPPSACLAESAATIGEQGSERSGDKIGPYKLLQQIGEGGMGTVYMAEQSQPVQRKVALKVIKAGMDSRQVVARFEAERQALAMMDHVNIARVLDAGTTEAGRPYFVMELVHGVPITKYCDDNQLTPRQRLELFVPVCQAIQHAHQKGIIHRDIKPSNVMITLYDGKPVPKVIDFGVAKATEQKLTERTLFTQFGTMVGTLEYMSPEQAEMSALGVDTRSDVYSLGVLLYELLTGSTPLSHQRVKEAAYAEILRLIKEEEPPKPSTRLSESGEALASISARRHTEPGKLSKLMRGELDWIVMKTLEKDRNRRYETANGLTADVQRYLADEPVLACPPSAGYRFRKSMRRNKPAVLVALTILAVLVAGIVGTMTGLVRAVAEAEEKEQARQAAEANFQRTREAVDEFFTAVSQSTLFDVPGLQPLRAELLEKAVRYFQEMAEKRGHDPDVLAGLALAHLRLAQVYHELNRNDVAIPTAVAGLEAVERLRNQYPDAIEHHRKLAGYWKGMRRIQLGTSIPKDPVAAERALTRFIAIWEEFVREIPDEPAFRSDLASVYAHLGELHGSNRRWDDCVVLLEKANATLEGLIRDFPNEPQYRSTQTMVCFRMYFYLTSAGRKGADEWAARALALQEKLVGDFPKVPKYQEDLAISLSFQGQQLNKAGRASEAAAVLLSSVSVLNRLIAQFPGTGSYAESQGRNFRLLLPLLKQTNQLQEAAQAYRQAIDLLATPTMEFPHAETHWYNLGLVHAQMGQWDQAVAGYDKAIELKPDYWEAWHNRGVAHAHLKQLEQAIVGYSKAIELKPDFGDAWHMRGWAHANLGQWDKAVADQSKALELIPTHWQTRWRRAQAHSKLKQWDLAISDYAKAIELGATNADVWLSKAAAHAGLEQSDPTRAGQWKAAIEALAKAEELTPSRSFGFNAFFLSMSNWQLDQKDEARKWYDQAVEWTDKNQPQNEQLRRYQSKAAELLKLEKKTN